MMDAKLATSHAAVYPVIKLKINAVVNINMCSHSPVNQESGAFLLTWKQTEMIISYT
jgi:hypothetical protein